MPSELSDWLSVLTALSFDVGSFIFPDWKCIGGLTTRLAFNGLWPLVLMLAVRPALKMLKSKGSKGDKADTDGAAQQLPAPATIDREGLDAQIQLAQQIAREQPEDAVMALRRMLAEPMPSEVAR